MRIATLILCLVVACEAGEKPAPPAPPVPAKPQWTGTVVDPALAYLAADTDLIIKVDVAGLRRMKLWSTYEKDIARMLVPDVACDYAPLRDISTVEIGVTFTSDLAVFVVRGHDRDQTLRCLHASPTARFDGDVVTVTAPTGTVDILTFVDRTTMVMQEGKQTKLPTKQTLAAALHVVGAPLHQDQALTEAMKRVPPKAGIAIISRPKSEEMRKKFGGVGVQMKYFYTSVDITDQPAVALAMRIGFVLDTADQATQFATMLKGQVGSPQVKQMFDRIDVGAQGDTTTMELALTESRLASLVGVFRMMQH